MFWIGLVICMIVFAAIGGVINGLVTVLKGEFDNDDAGITWLVIAIIICCICFM